MNRQLNLKIDIDSRKVTNYNGLVKQGDLVSLTINILSVKEEVNLNEQIVKIFLKKEDGTKVQQSVTVNKNIVTCELDLQVTTIVGKVIGELLVTKDNSQVTSSTFTFEVEGAISQEVLEESKDSIETFNKVISTLNEANTLIEQYRDSIQPIAGTTESVTALNNIKTYIDTNLSVLQDSNTKAEENIEALREFENVVEVVEDVAKLKTDVENNTASLSECVKKSNASINYYVSTTGSDTNDGLTSDTAFKTINHAIDSLPQIINHSATIHVVNGKYNEDVEIKGFSGCGNILFKGDDIVSNSRIINSLFIKNCNIKVDCVGFSIATNAKPSVNVENCINTTIANFNCTISNNDTGVRVDSSLVYIRNSIISNKNIAILAWVNSKILAQSMSGNNNNIVLQAVYNGEIGKDNNSITGNIAEQIGAGGVIR